MTARISEPSQRSAHREFQSQLIGGTLRSARKAPFYSRLWDGIDVNRLDIDTLCELPTTDKTTIQAAGDEARVRDGVRSVEVFTSGTSGTPALTLRGDRELATCREFFANVAQLQGGAVLKRGLQFANPYHGRTLEMPTPVHYHQLSVYDAGSFAYARTLIGRDCGPDQGVEPRLTVMFGLERIIRAFTVDTERAVGTALAGNLDTIITYSQMLTDRWRRRAETVWGCKVTDYFALSEFVSGALQSADCGWYFFSPVIVAEVVDRSMRPVAEGLGQLVLTSLHPFQEVQPLVRYRTGDLVEVTYTRSSRPGELAIRPLGRMRYGAFDERDGGWIVTPRALYEAVDDDEAIARLPRFVDASQVADPELIGHPVYALSTQHAGNVLQVDVQIAVRGPRAEADAACAGIAARIRNASPGLVVEEREGRAELRVVASENLAPALISHAE